MDPHEYYIGHGHTDMHARHSYITAHIFYEDLRKIQDSLPPGDIYENLKSNVDVDRLRFGTDSDSNFSFLNSTENTTMVSSQNKSGHNSG